MYKDILKIESDIVIKSEDKTVKNFRINGFSLPKSYQELSTELGYGILCNLFLTYIPFCEEKNICDSLNNQNLYLKNIFKEYLGRPLNMFNDTNNRDLIDHGEPFSMSENGEILFWDVRYCINNEYPVYLVDFPVGIYFAGSNMYEFINLVTVNTTFKKILKLYSHPLPPIFKPFQSIS